MDVSVGHEDYEHWVGRLYLERCQWEKAALALEARVKALEDAATPEVTP